MGDRKQPNELPDPPPPRPAPPPPPPARQLREGYPPLPLPLPLAPPAPPPPDDYEHRSDEIERLAGLVVERVLSVYREDYIERCVRTEPNSLLALVKQLEAAIDRL
jgi:hypothetical protein